MIGFSFTPDLMRNWRRVLKQTVKCRNEKLVYNYFPTLIKCKLLYSCWRFHFSHTPGSHVKPTTASLTFIHTITITASQIIQVYLEVQNMNLLRIETKFKIYQKQNEQLKNSRVGGWEGQAIAVNKKTTARLYTSHDLNPSPGPSSVWEKHFPLISFHSASGKSPVFNWTQRLRLHSELICICSNHGLLFCCWGILLNVLLTVFFSRKHQITQILLLRLSWTF